MWQKRVKKWNLAFHILAHFLTLHSGFFSYCVCMYHYQVFSHITTLIYQVHGHTCILCTLCAKVFPCHQSAKVISCKRHQAEHLTLSYYTDIVPTKSSILKSLVWADACWTPGPWLVARNSNLRSPSSMWDLLLTLTIRLWKDLGSSGRSFFFHFGMSPSFTAS